MQYKTCTHIYDNGHACGSAAAADRDYCAYHLHCRARVLRMAQYRARQQHWYLQLPPLENMHSVQSALTQLAEALAADMIDLKSADRLLAVLRLASRNLLKSDKWPATPIHSDQPGPAIDLAAEYGLPNNLDLSTSPEVAFPEIVILSEEHSDESKDPYISVGGPRLPDPSPMPTAGICHHGPDCREHVIRADYPFTPQLVELHDVLETEGQEAAALVYKQQQRNSHRRYMNAGRKRYAAIALEKNMRLAAEKMAERKLAEKAAATPASEGAIPPASGGPIPPAVGGVGTFPDTSKKPVTSVGTGDAIATEEGAIA